jgi:MHS family proline/betaine transporter-like MFS transporter
MNNIFSNHSPQLVKKIFASGAVGNILETYDLILISLLATTFSKVFFPPTDNTYANMVNILYVFLIGLLVRPIGNIVMGSFADQIGRKKMMIVSLIFTALGTAIIGILPTYDMIGIWSTILFLILRISINFFAGIEYINSATYLIENSESNTRGFYASWTALGISGGYLLASFVVFIVYNFINKGILPQWGWRFIFLFPLLGIIFGTWLRYSIPESFVFIMNNRATNIIKKREIFKNSLIFIKNNPKHCLSIAAITFLGTCLSFIYYIFIPIYLITTREFSQNEVISLNVFSLLLIVILIPIFGKLSDRYETFFLLKLVCFFIFFLALPFFWIAVYGNYLQLLIVCLLISVPSSCFFSLYPLIITESFPPKIRCTTAALIYQIVLSIEMGTLPLLINYLIMITNIPYITGYVLIFSAIIGYIGLLFITRKKNKVIFENNKKLYTL